MLGGGPLHPGEIPPGTLYLLILRTLAGGGEMHGYEIANSVATAESGEWHDMA